MATALSPHLGGIQAVCCYVVEIARFGSKVQDEIPCPVSFSIDGNMALLLPYVLLSFMVTTTAFLLDVGAPRTGTQSMFAALQILGLNPVHTGYERLARLPLCSYLFGGNYSLDDALALLRRFDGGMDEPTMLLYEEVMAAIPDAKFLLTISDPESWYENYVKGANSMNATRFARLKRVLPYDCEMMRSWGCNFDFPSEGKEECLQNYAKHNQRVQEVIPAEKLLVYNWSDGWSPLCHFLGLPVPDEDFPHVDVMFQSTQESPIL